MRAFVAIFPPPEVRHALVEAAHRIPGFRPTATERAHLTLKFLGDVPPEALPRIASALEHVSAGQEPFEVATSDFGVFPSPRRASILWAGFDEGTETLSALARAVQTRLEQEGFARENRPYIPHITLARARHPTPFDPTNASLPKLRFTALAINLVQSKHEPTGIAYSTLARYEF